MHWISGLPVRPIKQLIENQRRGLIALFGKDTSKPVPVSVGGASGMQIDVTASSTLEDRVPLYPISWDEISAAPSDEGLKDRYVILDVGGETVIINVFAPQGKFDTFSPKAQEVLDSVEWKGR